MRVLPKPALSPSLVLSSCISGVDDDGLRARMQAQTNELLKAASDFANAAANSSLHTVAKDVAATGLTRKELEGLYTEQMSKSDGAARQAYSALMNAAPNRKCPLCGVGFVTTLDHHLPKSRYPNLSVVPLNLVPCCFDCNKAKGIRIPGTIQKQTFHPYFDDFTKDIWLEAVAVQGPPLTIAFRAEPPDNFTDLDKARVRHHFAALKLAERYTSNANDELSGLKPSFQKVYDADGDQGLLEFVQEQVQLSSSRVNSWQHATYRALASAPWFSAGGHAQISDPDQ